MARHHRLLGYVDCLADAQARAQELLTLNQAMQDISPSVVEFMELLELARSRNGSGPHQPAPRPQ